MAAPHQTKRFLEARLKEKGIWLKKKLGQCFLIDINKLKKIVRQGHIDGGSAVLEIGCGSGMLTQFLARKAAIVWAIEVDSKLLEIAREMLESCENVVIIDGSILDRHKHIDPHIVEMVQGYLQEHPEKDLRIVSNLPYYLATAIIMELLETDLPVSEMTLTVQKEVAERLAARPGSKPYGGVSVIGRVNARIELVEELRPNLFWPRPEVSSSIIQIIPDRSLRNTIEDYDFFKEFVKAVFLYRRKKMSGAMKHAGFFKKGDSELLEAAGFDLGKRAEEHTVRDFIEMSNILSRQNAKRTGT